MDYSEAAQWLGVPRKWLETEVQNNRAPHVRLGKYVRFTQQHLDAIVAKHEKHGGPAPTPVVGTGPRPAPRRRSRQPS